MRYDFIKYFKTKFNILAISAILNVIAMLIIQVRRIYYLLNEQSLLTSGAYDNVELNVPEYVWRFGDYPMLKMLFIEIIVLLLLFFVSPGRRLSDKRIQRRPIPQRVKTILITVFVITILFTTFILFVNFNCADITSEQGWAFMGESYLSDVNVFVDLADFFIEASKDMICFLAVELVMVVMLVWLKSKSMSISHNEDFATSA